ncbi:hypothetical protein BBNG_00611 [Bifidobacterium bifidum NCIMB 41171]|nr:hypothetical protein BBNG_00611 [Bifidobacterium bifidum NCIMB 41171]
MCHLLALLLKTLLNPLMDDCGDRRLAFRGHHLERRREGGALPVRRRVGDNSLHHPGAVQTRVRSFIVKAIVRASSSDGASISRKRTFSIKLTPIVGMPAR